MSRLDYHHIPKVLDLVAACGAKSVLEAHDGEALYAPLMRAFLPDLKQVDEAAAEEAHVLRKNYDLVICSVPSRAPSHASLDHVRALLERHRSVLLVAPKSDWEKADFAELGPILFVNDPTGIIAYLAETANIKTTRRNLLGRRVRRQSSLTPTVEAFYKTVRRVAQHRMVQGVAERSKSKKRN
ncbi:hypothetical protein M0Q28_05160 [Patescibacteria group bacterium]|jgi:hypothetical protein|nr:hypothetical protein [Patescibacteria group bacterium]